MVRNARGKYKASVEMVNYSNAVFDILENKNFEEDINKLNE